MSFEITNYTRSNRAVNTRICRASCYIQLQLTSVGWNLGWTQKLPPLKLFWPQQHCELTCILPQPHIFKWNIALILNMQCLILLILVQEKGCWLLKRVKLITSLLHEIIWLFWLPIKTTHGYWKTGLATKTKLWFLAPKKIVGNKKISVASWLLKNVAGNQKKSQGPVWLLKKATGYQK